MNYQRIYDSLISNAKARKETSGYTEIHHIHPKSLGGFGYSQSMAFPLKQNQNAYMKQIHLLQPIIQKRIRLNTMNMVL